MVVRTGNPKGIDSWDDLIKPGVGIVTPEPGLLRLREVEPARGVRRRCSADGGTDEDAQAYMKKFFGNVAALPDSGRDATTAFTSGTGDVLLSYENEAILARQSGTDFDYVIPDSTLLIENPCAVTEARPTAAQDFLDFQKSADGQKLYAETGYRPLVDVGDVEVEGANDPSDPFPEPRDAAHHRRRLRRLGRRQHEVLRRERRHPHQDPGGGGPVTHECLCSCVGAAAASDRGRPARKRRPARSHSSARSLTPGSALGLGVAMLWFSLLVLIPLSAVVVMAADGGWSTFVDAVTNQQTLAPLKLTVFTSLGVTAAQHGDGHDHRLGAGP